MFNSHSFRFIAPFFAICFTGLCLPVQASEHVEGVSYRVSFENAVHHEAKIEATFHKTSSDELIVQMSRTSPGRYALHEFAKNVYQIEAFDQQKRPLKVERRDPFRWAVAASEGDVTVTYILFADRADGTYSQIDRTHAHLNIPATFIWSPAFWNSPISVELVPFKENWKVASQLVKGDSSWRLTAPNFDYFMDSPIELSAHDLKSWSIKDRGKDFQMNLALHHLGNQDDVERYFQLAQKVVAEVGEIYGSYPDFDFGQYTFIACYLPHVNGDGMEHRNSTVLTSSHSLDDAEFKQIRTLAHEFFHAWNVERIRPKSLQPFQFMQANMSQALWLAEGFTLYYDGLLVKRIGEYTEDDYLEVVSSIINQSEQSRGRLFLSPVQASQMATFTDAGRFNDPTNFDNTYFNYYLYGRVVALALDLELRAKYSNLSLDHFMRLLWQKFGKSETPYQIADIQQSLTELTGDGSFAANFFQQYIYDNQKPNFNALLAPFALQVDAKSINKAFAGDVEFEFVGKDAMVSNSILIEAPLYKAGVEKGDRIIRLGRREIHSQSQWEKAIAQFKPGDVVPLVFEQRGEIIETSITLIGNEKLTVSRVNSKNSTKKQIKRRALWLKNEIKK